MNKEAVKKLRSQLSEIRTHVAFIEQDLDDHNYGTAAEDVEALKEIACDAYKDWDQAVAEDQDEN